MTTTTFDESAHPRQATGEFTAKVNDAPAGSLSTKYPTPVDTYVRDQQLAAGLFEAAKHTYMQANAASAAAQLRAAFPGAAMAIFSRDWEDDETQIRLAHILGEGLDDDIDFDESVDPDWLTPAQANAVQQARRLVREMGPDVSAYLEDSETDHVGWEEYILPLADEPDAVDTAGALVDSIEATQRSALDSALSDRDGRLISSIDTGEVAYQLWEGRVYDESPELGERLLAKFGSEEAAATAIAETTAYERFRDDIDWTVRERMSDALPAAAAEALAR